MLLRPIRYKSIYNLNSEFLDDGLISHEHAWWWGWFLTDGGISTCRRTIQPPKEYVVNIKWDLKYDSYPILQKLRQIVGSTHPIIFDQPKGKPNPNVVLLIYSAHLCKEAAKLMKCDPWRKTFDLQFPTDIDALYLPALIRGIFEGDGCWLIRAQNGNVSMSFQITSANELFLQVIKRKINKYALRTHLDEGSVLPRKEGHIFDLRYHKRIVCNDIGEWLYGSDQIDKGLFMCRKYERFQLLQRLSMDDQSLSKSDKVLMLSEHLNQEEIDLKRTLTELISMSRESKNKPEIPPCFRFRRKFFEIVVG